MVIGRIFQVGGNSGLFYKVARKICPGATVVKLHFTNMKLRENIFLLK